MKENTLRNDYKDVSLKSLEVEPVNSKLVNSKLVNIPNQPSLPSTITSQYLRFNSFIKIGNKVVFHRKFFEKENRKWKIQNLGADHSSI